MAAHPDAITQGKASDGPSPTWDTDYRKVAEAYFARFEREQTAARSYAADLAKWLLASLVLINGGALLTLVNAMPRSHAALVASGYAFVFGIVTAVGCGTIAWINSGLLALAYENYANPKMMVSIEHWPTSPAKFSKLINGSYVGALLFGLMSLAAFVFGCFLAGQTVL
jgi:hypothetical protein